MSNRDSRVRAAQQRAAEADRMKSIPFVLRVTPTLAGLMRSEAFAKGFRTVQEWLRSLAVAAAGRK